MPLCRESPTNEECKYCLLWNCYSIPALAGIVREVWEKCWNCESSVGIVTAVLALWQQCWDCESSVSPTAVAVQASSSNGESSLTSSAGRASAQETPRCPGKPPRLENRSRAGVCPGLKWLKVITICSSELRGWYQSSFRYCPSKVILSRNGVGRREPWLGGSKGAPSSTCRQDGRDLKLTYMSSLYDASGGNCSFLLSVWHLPLANSSH